MTTIRCVLLLALLVSLGSPARAAAEPSSSAANRGSWLSWNKSTDKSAVKTKKVSAMSGDSKSSPGMRKMTQAPKRMVSNTKKMLTPKSQSDKDITSAQASRNLKSQQPGFFKSLFNPEPPPPPQTIKDWMKLKQIHP